MGFKINTKDLDRLEKSLRNAPKRVTKDIDAIVYSAGNTAVAVAKRYSPVDKGALRNAMNLERVEPLLVDVYNNIPYAPFVEFGTGKKVEIPDDFKELASNFKNGGSGTFEEGLENITAWCIRKGIPEESAFGIFMAIIKVGINPQPFLYPGFKAGKKILIQDVNDYIDNFSLDG